MGTDRPLTNTQPGYAVAGASGIVVLRYRFRRKGAQALSQMAPQRKFALDPAGARLPDAMHSNRIPNLTSETA